MDLVGAKSEPLINIHCLLVQKIYNSVMLSGNSNETGQKKSGLI